MDNLDKRDKLRKMDITFGVWMLRVGSFEKYYELDSCGSG
jgi:hypothetical protein